MNIETNNVAENAKIINNIKDKLIFHTDNFLSKKDLQKGHVYVQKDGRATVYLGKDMYDRFVFYDLAGIMFEDAEDYRTITLGHYDFQVQSLISICSILMQNKCNIKQLRTLKGVPSLYGDFCYVNFEATIDNWCEQNALNNKEFPKLVTNDMANENTKIWVGAKDLVPGELYYTGNLWRALYLYLGRDSEGFFCWYFVGNETVLTQNDINIYLRNCERTKSNKKCKRLSYALNDPDAFIYADAKYLIDTGWKADLSGLNLG